MKKRRLFVWHCAALCALVLSSPTSSAIAAPERHQPIVLNGHLATGDFSGGVGYGMSGGGYSYGTAIVYSGTASTSYAATVGFIAAARGTALGGQSMNGPGTGHR